MCLFGCVVVVAVFVAGVAVGAGIVITRQVNAALEDLWTFDFGDVNG